jgi:hypothetical protein
MDLYELFLPVKDVLDISSDLNPALIGMFLLIILLGEINIQIPLLMESIWLLIGYQSGMNNMALFNAALILLLAQITRLVPMFALYYLFPIINKSFAKHLVKPTILKRFYQKYIYQKYFDTEYLSPLSSTLGMLTWLNLPIRLLLIWRRNLRSLLIGTLFSGLVFDGTYLLAGAILRTTELSLAYLPAVFLAVFLAFSYIKIKVVRNVPQV